MNTIKHSNCGKFFRHDQFRIAEQNNINMFELRKFVPAF
jgi:hypothetical protein